MLRARVEAHNLPIQFYRFRHKKWDGWSRANRSWMGWPREKPRIFMESDIIQLSKAGFRFSVYLRQKWFCCHWMGWPRENYVYLWMAWYIIQLSKTGFRFSVYLRQKMFLLPICDWKPLSLGTYYSKSEPIFRILNFCRYVFEKKMLKLDNYVITEIFNFEDEKQKNLIFVPDSVTN